MAQCKNYSGHPRFLGLCWCVCLCVSGLSQWKWLRWVETFGLLGAQCTWPELPKEPTWNLLIWHMPVWHTRTRFMHPLQMWNKARAGILVHVCTVCHSPSRASDNTLVSVFAQKGKSIPADIPIGCDLSACVFSGFFYTTNHYLKYFRDLL